MSQQNGEKNEPALVEVAEMLQGGDLLHLIAHSENQPRTNNYSNCLRQWPTHHIEKYLNKKKLQKSTRAVKRTVYLSIPYEILKIAALDQFCIDVITLLYLI